MTFTKIILSLKRYELKKKTIYLINRIHIVWKLHDGMFLYIVHAMGKRNNCFHFINRMEIST